MSTERDVTRIVRSWLEEGATALPDRVLDAVLDQVPATSQRRSWWPARRFSEMNTPYKLAIAAAAVVVVAVVGIYLLPRQGGIAGPGPSPTPGSTPVQLPTGSLAAGTTYFISDPCCVGPARLVLTVPAGWASIDPILVGKDVQGDPKYDVLLGAHLVGNVYTGGCNWSGTALSPPVGPTVDDLAIALNAQAGPAASPPTDVDVGGHHGKKVELSIPEDLDVTTCDSDGDFPIFGRWYTGQPFGAGPWTYGDGQRNTVYIVDVDGTRQVIDTMYLPGTSAADRAELDQIVASIRFEPRAGSPSPSP